MESSMFTFVLLCVVWINVEAISVDIPKDEYEVARDRNTTIPCKFTTSKSPGTSVITWSRRKPNADTTDILTYYYPDNETNWEQTFDPKRFDAKIDFKKGQADLNLNFLRLEDSMIYECRVQIRGDSVGKSNDKTNLVVLVAPSKPICKVNGDSEYGQNINLTCVSEEASPEPSYKWESYDVMNNLRPLISKNTVKEGLLSLFNVSKETSGYYICTSSNKVGSASCNITVAIMPPSLKMGKTAGIIAGFAVFLLLLVVAICLCCYCRKKNKNKKGNEYPMGDREEYNDMDTEGNDEKRLPDGEESPQAYRDSKGLADQQNHDAERRERYDDRRSDHDDRRSDYDDRRRDNDDRRRDNDDRRRDNDDRRRDNDDRRRDYDDRRRDYDDRRRDYDDRRSDYDDRRSDYDDRRSDCSDRRDKYSDRNERYDDDRRYDNDNRRGQR